jgi:hypothetical protein
MGEIRELPQELFLAAIEYIVPNIKSPTHPEEIKYQDNQLVGCRSVCKAWQRCLDRRLTFKDLEQIFLVNYHWPWEDFAPFCKKHFQVLNRSSVDQSFVIEQQQQIGDYNWLMLRHKEIKNESGHKHKTGMFLKTGIENNFYSHLYDLLPNKEYYLWQELFGYAIEMAFEADKKNLLSNVTTQNRTTVITICKQQYLRYVDCHGRYDYIENFVNRYCENKLDDVFFEQRDEKQIPTFIFGLQELIGSGLNQQNMAILNRLDEYIKSGGFICRSLYHCIFYELYYADQDQKNPFFERLSFVASGLNMNVFLGVQFALVLRLGVPLKKPLYLCNLESKIMMLDYQIFFLSFMNVYDYYDKNYCYNHKITFEVRAGIFFEYNQEWLLKRDKNNKTFLYYLLLLVSKNRLPYSIIKSFINAYSTVLDQTYRVEEQEKLECQRFLQLVSAIWANNVNESDQKILEKIVGVKEKARSKKMKSLLSKIAEYITHDLRPLTDGLITIFVFFGPIFFMGYCWAVIFSE